MIQEYYDVLSIPGYSGIKEDEETDESARHGS